jgi:hypothetical protein
MPLAEAIRARATSGAVGQRAIAAVETPSGDPRWFDLEADKWIDEEPSASVSDSDSDILDFILAEQRRTNALLIRLVNLLGDNRGNSFGRKPRRRAVKRLII